MSEATGQTGGERGFVRDIADKKTNFAQWYTDVILKSEMVDYAPVRGCMVIRPYAYGIWERIRDLLDVRFKATGHSNAYFPLFIPESFLRKESEHFEGFDPEVAWVTHGGGEALTERLAVRPTSETVICTMYAKWIQSYRDLPILINQWSNVVRWEKSTRPFLRTMEFLWQEGHTAHRTADEAEAETRLILDVYRDFVQDELAIPVIAGRKSEAEKFAGALRTYAIEALMTDGQALQAGTSHNLGQHFAKVFDIQFLDTDGQLKHVWQTSWGVSTRLIGGLVMVHGDERGLALPPRIAPVQVVVVPIAPKPAREAVLREAALVAGSLGKAARVHVDDREEQTPGFKFNYWELRGVPLRLEIGPRDIASGQVVLVRRDTGAKLTAPRGELATLVPRLLEEIQGAMLARATSFREAHTRDVAGIDQLESFLAGTGGFARAGWCGEHSCEAQIKQRTGATIRVLVPDGAAGHTCLVCGAQARETAYFARAY
ncbi:MAG: proline--tRNA ligase [Bacillota bacterium]|nr:proline--tRNA ligase [Bacillota bacterium]